MPLTVTLTPGKQFAENEALDNDKLNALGQPTVAVVGALHDLSDVDTASPVQGDVPYWDTTDSKYKLGKPAFVGADSTNAGTAGMVPAPAAGQNGLVLFGDGTWGAVPVDVAAEHFLYLTTI
jgi:hypothetical protein